MRRNLEIAFISIVLICRLPIQQVSAEVPPRGVLAPRAGGYVFVDCPGAFDALNDEGITVEWWFYLTEVPADWQERWDLICKPHSYCYSIQGKFTGPPWSHEDPQGTVNICERILDSFSSSYRIQNPLQQWHHIAIQLRFSRQASGTIAEIARFHDGECVSNSTRMSSMIYQPDGMLFIGGRPGYDPLKGWIDEVRISSIWRYTPGEIFKPERESSRDQHTLVLWHFSEGDWARQYEDSSGNGYTLLGGGTMLVDRKNRLPTAWGWLKDTERY